MLFKPDDSGKRCRGCDETLDENDKRRGFFCSYCKGVTESHYTGFWSAIKMVKDYESFEYTGEYAIGVFATYLEADTCAGQPQRGWIKGFSSREEVSVVLNALAEFHKGYAVSDTITTVPHPIYGEYWGSYDFQSVREEGRI